MVTGTTAGPEVDPLAPPEAGPEGARPWYNAKSVVQTEAVALRRRLRWLRRRTVQRFADWQRAQVETWAEVPTARIAKCGRVAWDEQVSIHGLHTDDGFSAYPVGVVACGSVWSCSCCSAVIRTRRSIEVQVAASAHVAAGGSLLMLTLTLRHSRGQTLAELLDALKTSWKSVQQHRQWRPIRAALVGSITATEVTWGANGWHPHLHLLLFVPEGGSVDLSWLPETWQATVGGNLAESAPDLVHGVDVRSLDASAAEYVAKIADETTRADLKGDSKSVWTLLDAVADGETWAIAMWAEWFAATKGRRAIVWSRGLKDRFGLAEVADEDVVQVDVVGQVFVEEVPSDRWLSWCRTLTPTGVVKALAHLEQIEARTTAGGES